MGLELIEDAPKAQPSVVHRRFRSDLLVPLLFLALAALQAPCPGQHHADEGFNLMKALLCRHGYTLYQEIWSDQPPVLTFLLQISFHGLGVSVGAGRFLVVLLAALLLWSFFRALEICDGPATAWLGVGLLFASRHFLDLSMRVMVGLPAIAFALLALCWLLFYLQSGRAWWLVLSAIMMAVSLQTKLFTLPWLPLFGVALLGPVLPEGIAFSRRQRAGALLMWLTCLAAAYLAMGWYFGVELKEHLLSPHLGPQVREAFRAWNSSGSVSSFFRMHAAYLPLAIAALGFRLASKSWQVLLPAAGLACVTVALLCHRPVWSNHVLLVTVPLSWLAALALRPLLAVVRRRWSADWTKGLTATLTALAVFFYARQLARSLQEATCQRAAKLEEVQIVQQLQAHGHQTRWVFTDRPYLAFAAGLLMPPELAVCSGKRWCSGLLGAGELIRLLDKYRPEQIVLGRLAYPPMVMAFIAERYRPIPGSAQHQYFISRAVGDEQ